jgi:PAS domain S-box-containing protein
MNGSLYRFWMARWRGHHRERALFKQIVESAPNAIVLMARDGSIELVNAQTEKLFRYTSDDLIGKPVEVLVPMRFRDAHPGHRESFAAHPSVRAMGAGRELYGLRRDGTEFPVEIGLNPILDDPEGRVLASIIDITERKRAEERIRHMIQ